MSQINHQISPKPPPPTRAHSRRQRRHTRHLPPSLPFRNPPQCRHRLHLPLLCSTLYPKHAHFHAPPFAPTPSPLPLPAPSPAHFPPNTDSKAEVEIGDCSHDRSSHSARAQRRRCLCWLRVSKAPVADRQASRAGQCRPIPPERVSATSCTHNSFLRPRPRHRIVPGRHALVRVGMSGPPDEDPPSMSVTPTGRRHHPPRPFLGVCPEKA